MSRSIRLLGRCSDPTLRALSRRLFSRSWRRFEEVTENPRRAQELRLAQILERAAGTEFGRRHGFAEIRSVADYQARVPVQGYDGFEPDLRRMVNGEPNILTAEQPFFFARSSGTTGSPKYIPVTPSYLAEYRRPRRVWMRQVMQHFPGLLRGKILTMHSPQIEGRTPTGVPYGSITVAMSGSPELGTRTDRFGMEPAPRRLYLVPDFQQKYYLLLRLAAQEDIRLAAAINPSTLVLLAKKLDEFAEALAEDLEDGTARGLDRLPEPLRSEIGARLVEAPRAADRIRAAMIRRGRVRPVDLWPELVGLLCWKGGSAPFYLKQLEAAYPGRPIMDYGFLATEGGFSIPLSPEGAAGVIAVHGHFLEFFPEHQAEAGSWRDGRLADDLVPGERYRVVLTGSHGLYRYDINDVVECAGRYRGTAQVVFVQKGGNMLSLTGEKVGEAHVAHAFATLSRNLGLELGGFCVSAELSETPRYVFALELAELPAEPMNVIEACDRALAEANLEYAAKRASERLGPPKLWILRPGTFEAERRRRVAAGAPDSHVKPLHLVRDLARLQALGVWMEYPGVW